MGYLSVDYLFTYLYFESFFFVHLIKRLFFHNYSFESRIIFIGKSFYAQFGEHMKVIYLSTVIQCDVKNLTGFMDGMGKQKHILITNIANLHWGIFCRKSFDDYQFENLTLNLKIS